MSKQNKLERANDIISELHDLDVALSPSLLKRLDDVAKMYKKIMKERQDRYEIRQFLLYWDPLITVTAELLSDYRHERNGIGLTGSFR